MYVFALPQGESATETENDCQSTADIEDASQEKAAPPLSPRRVAGWQLRVTSYIDGQQVSGSPQFRNDESKWTISYSITEFTEDKAINLYASSMKRRLKSFTKIAREQQGDESVKKPTRYGDVYRERLLVLAREGRRELDRMSEMESSRKIVVWKSGDVAETGTEDVR